MRQKLASISVDLDEVPCYAAVHGVQMPEGSARHAVYERCVPRLAGLFERESIQATFFAIGQDLDRDPNRDTLASLHRAGHEIGNHSYHHHYDLARRPKKQIREEIERCSEVIEDACGSRPKGFRAPGYTVSDTLFEALDASEITYDSSVFPCPSYYAVKLSALGLMTLRGRKSESIVDTPAVLRAPKQPYRVGRPYWRKGDGLLEIPIGVTRWLLPYIGTSLVLWGATGARRLTRQMLGQELINLELHGFDVADAGDDRLEMLRPHRPDLRKTAREKLAALSAALEVLRESGYEIVPLEEAARRLNGRPSL